VNRTNQWLGLLGLLFVTFDVCAAPATVAGVISLPEPTLQHISVVWPITGDDDRDGVVSVRYRPVESGLWQQGMPLRRVAAASNENFSWGESHRGTIFGLQANTSYQIELTLNDPDGGSTQRLEFASTRPVPTAGNGIVRPATPATLNTVLNAAQPGDIVQLGNGNYSGFTITNEGSPGAPLTLRGRPGATINGALELFSRDHIRLENLRVNGRIRFNGSNDIAIVGCTVNASDDFANYGIVSFTRAERAYIANNTVTGTTAWQASSFGGSVGEGIELTGPGHVIENNTVSGFRDGISLREDDLAVDQYSVDILNNTISQVVDDAIEADFCAHNCRIIGNRISNSFVGMSSQPSLGGPNYFIRNQAYNLVHLAFKQYRNSRGDVILHNTIVKHGDGFGSFTTTTARYALVLNNLFLGGPAGTFNGFPSGTNRVVDQLTLDTSTSRLDYNGYGTTLAAFNGTIGSQTFSSVAQMQNRTSEVNGLRVGYDVFANSVSFPASPTTVYPAVNFSLANDAVAVDRGVVIPGINDNYDGSAPDLGAIEQVFDGQSVLFEDGFEAAN